MKSKYLIRSFYIALILFLLQYGIDLVSRLFYRQYTGSRPGDIQRHNIMVADYADWIFTFIVAGMWIFLYLRDHRPGYRRLFIEIASTFGMFSVIFIIKTLITLSLSTNIQGTLSDNIAWIMITMPLFLIKTTFLTGIIAAAIIAVINRLQPIASESENREIFHSIDKTTPVKSFEPSSKPLQETTFHPLFSGAVIGGMAGLLFAVAFILFPKIVGRGMELVMFALLPIGIMYQEFMSFDPFIPKIFSGYEKAYTDMMALLSLTSLGIIVASFISCQEARNENRVSFGRLLRISIYIGGAISLIRMSALVIFAPKYIGGIFGIPVAWITGSILIGIIIFGFKSGTRLGTIPSSSAPLIGAKRIIVGAVLLVVAAMVAGQTLDIKERRGLNVFTTQHDKERKQRESTEGLLIDHCEAHWDNNGDFIISGLVTNTTNLIKPWFIDAKTLDKDNKVLSTAKMLDGRQLFSLKEIELLANVRKFPDCAIRGPERQLVPQSTSRFELRMIQPPPETVSYSLTLVPPPYNELATNELQDMKGALEKHYVEMGSSVEKSQQTKAIKKPTVSSHLDSLGCNVFMSADYTTEMQATAKTEIFRLRQREIDRYRDFGIYPTDYAPKESIFGEIDDKTAWLQDVPLFLFNPYLLVIEAGGEYVNGIFAYCPMSSLVYSPKRITISYEKESAKRWRYHINDHYQDSKGIIRLWFVNAIDAGFPYAHVDSSKSENIEPIPGATVDHVMRGIYSPAELFHVGRYKKNNISPNDARAKIKLKDPNAKTTIHVKLWREKPNNPNSAEDFSYVIAVSSIE